MAYMYLSTDGLLWSGTHSVTPIPTLLREGIATLLLLMSRYRLKDDGRGGKALTVVAIVDSGIVYHWTLDL